MTLLKDSERSLTDKLKESRKEMEKMTTIINQLWPFIQSHLKKELGSAKIASLKKMAKEESRINFLETLSNVIGKVKKDAEKDGRSLFGTDLESKYEKLKNDYSKFDQIERDLRAKLYEKDMRNHKSKTLIDKLKTKVRELEAFRLTATDFVMTKATSQEEILFLVRANERISAFQEKDMIEGDEKFEDGGFITKQRHYEILDDYEPAPAFLKAMTNEILYLEQQDEESWMHDSNNMQLLSDNYNETTDYLNSDNLCIPKQESEDIGSYLHLQKINSYDQVPELIKDTLAENLQRARENEYEDIGDDTNPSFSKKTLVSLKQASLNATSDYDKLEPLALSSYQYDKLGSSLDIERRLQHNIHGRQVQPSNTSQKLLSSRINAYAK